MKVSQRLPRENGRDYALRNIKANIVNLELAPGSQISENELAEELGLSRTPVREALIELSKAEIIEIQPQRRSTVSLIDCGLVEEARFMRNLERLEASIRLQSFYLDGTYTTELMDLDNQFHGALFDIAQKSRVFRQIQILSIHFDRVRGLALSAEKDLKVVQDHQQLVEFIRKTDGASARRLMEVHLNRYRIDAAEISRRYPQYFK